MCLKHCLNKITEKMTGASPARPVEAGQHGGVVLENIGHNPVDLTHALSEEMPTFFGVPQFEIERVATVDNEGFNINKWAVVEHTGTHLDAPLHCSNDGISVAEIPVESLVVPLIVVDIRDKADADADAQLTPDDLKKWISKHGSIPSKACVAMNSGWSHFIRDSKFRNADDNGVLHFPGFHPEATQMLMEETDASGIAVDTLSLDYGQSQDFGVHTSWLPAGRWGIEGIANLDNIPDKGGVIIVGAPKVVGGSGGPGRILALI